MKFDFAKRLTDFGVFNNRRENEGQEKKVLKAIDLPFRFPVKRAEVDMLIPGGETKASDFLLGSNKRKSVRQVHVLTPLTIYRHPEHLNVTIYDDGVDKRKCMKFKECKVKDPQLEIEDDGKCFVTGKFQIHPMDLLQRISDNVEARTCECEIESTQSELFDGEEGEGGGDSEGGQGNLPGTEGGAAGDDDDDED